jgi:hypothetical protein
VADQNLEINVDVNTNDANAKFAALTQELGKIRQAAEGAGPSVQQLEKAFLAGQLAGDAIVGTFKLLGAAVGELFTNFSRGAEINDLSQSFDTLSAKAGTTSDVLLDKLSKATLGTINNLDLMKIANESMIAGLSPQALEDVAKAATTYADKTGTDAKQAIEKFTTALTKGNDAQLKAIGLNIDNAKAVKDFAEAHGVAVDKVSELGKAEAVREAALQKLRDTTASLGGVTQDTKDAYDSIGVALQNQLDQVFKSVAANDDLRVAFNDVANAIKSVDLKPFIDGISGAISFVSNFASEAIPAATLALEDFERGLKVIAAIKFSDIITGLDGVARAQQQVASDEQKKNTDAVTESLHKLADVGQFVDAAMRSVADGVQVTQKQVAEFRKELDKLPKSYDSSIGGANKYNTENYEIRKNLDELQKTLPKVSESLNANSKEWFNNGKAGKDATEKLRQETEKFFEMLHEKSGDDPVFNDLVSQFATLKIQVDGGVISNQQFADSQEEVGRAFLRAGGKLNELSAAYQRGGAVAAGYEKITQEAVDASKKGLDEVARKAEEFQKQIDEALKSGFGNLVQDFLKGDFKGGLGGLGSSLGSVIGNHYGEQIGKDLGAAVGGLAGSIGGPIGAGIGASLGSALGSSLGKGLNDAIGHVFGGGHNEETEARKKVDAFFADLFEKNHLKVIIDGQLKDLLDLDFGGSNGFDTGKFDDALLGSADAIKGAFIGVGDAMNQLLNTGKDLGGQLAAVFYNNVGGSLNNLQLLIQATGFSAQQMTDAIVSSAKKGTISFLEAQSAINGINKAMQKGIPDAVGASVQAFQNLLDAGSKGGQASIKALQDIGTEALELGKHTLPQLQQLLVASGKFTNEQITKLFQDLAAHGIKSVDDLSKATDATLINILSDLQAQGVLQEASKQAESLIDKINSIPKEKDITFNVNAKYSNGADKVIQQAAAGAPPDRAIGKPQ